MAEHSKLRGRRNSLDDELLSLLERLSVVHLDRIYKQENR